MRLPLLLVFCMAAQRRAFAPLTQGDHTQPIA
jgi:hypothetical protein